MKFKVLKWKGLFQMVSQQKYHVIADENIFHISELLVENSYSNQKKKVSKREVWIHSNMSLLKCNLKINWLFNTNLPKPPKNYNEWGVVDLNLMVDD